MAVWRLMLRAKWLSFTGYTVGQILKVLFFSMSTASQNTWGDKGEDMRAVNLVSSVINQLKKLVLDG